MGGYFSKRQPKFPKELFIPVGGGAINITSFVKNTDNSYTVNGVATDGYQTKEISINVSIAVPLIDLCVQFPFLTKEMRTNIYEYISVYHDNKKIHDGLDLREIMNAS
jgi:hypothetical protein